MVTPVAVGNRAVVCEYIQAIQMPGSGDVAHLIMKGARYGFMRDFLREETERPSASWRRFVRPLDRTSLMELTTVCAPHFRTEERSSLTVEWWCGADKGANIVTEFHLRDGKISDAITMFLPIAN
jgi:hypothetical protein